MEYSVKRIESKVGKEFLREKHYTHSCHNGPMCWGLYDSGRLIGVCAFATPSSEAVRRSVFGPGREGEVTELHRLFIEDGTPTNTESWFIARALRGLKEYKPKYNAVISFSDSTEGHVGTIYQASNAWYCGKTGRARFWRDPEGRLRHPRQGGHNVTPEEAEEKGWTAEMRGAKNRYLFFLGTPRNKKFVKSRCLLTPQPYPQG